MLPNKDLTQQQAQWIVEFYAPKMNHRIDNTSIQWHQKTFNYIKGTNAPIPSCNCHYVSAAKVAQSLYSQYEADIKAIAYPPKTTTRGRKKK